MSVLKSSTFDFLFEKATKARNDYLFFKKQAGILFPTSNGGDIDNLRHILDLVDEDTKRLLRGVIYRLESLHDEMIKTNSNLELFTEESIRLSSRQQCDKAVQREKKPDTIIIEEDLLNHMKRDLAIQREKVLIAERERDLARERERDLARQRERDLARERERERDLVLQKERDLVLQRERERDLVIQRERDLARQREIQKEIDLEIQKGKDLIVERRRYSMAQKEKEKDMTITIYECDNDDIYQHCQSNLRSMSNTTKPMSIDHMFDMMDFARVNNR